MEPTTKLKVRTNHLNGTLEYEPFRKWLLPIEGRALLCRNGCKMEVGSTFGFIVRRDRIVPDFLEQMEYPSTETMNLALNIFDRHGRLKGEYTNHPARRGLGIWQNELSEGDFLIIETATVLKKARRQGIGRQLVMDMIQKATKLDTNVRFVFAYPSCLHMAEDLQERTGKTKKERFGMADAQTAVAIRFFRQLGFRRIGISHWFALSIDINHLSRTVSIADDPDPPEVEPILYGDYDSDDPQPEVPKARSVIIGEPLGTDRDFNYNEVKSSRQEVADHLQEKANRRRARSEYAQLYPIHHALQSLSDFQCLAMLKERTLKGDGSQGVLIESKDCYKNNILHIAACNFKPACVEWILNSIAINHPNLKNGRNIHGYTPLEALQSQLDVERLGEYLGQRFIVRADKFEGFSNEAVSCIQALHERPIKDDIHCWNRTRFGCTCGLCLGGFLSRRMRQSLQTGAEQILNRLELTENTNNRNWCAINGDFLDYIPGNIRSTFKKGKVLRRGLREFTTTFIECLQAGRCPTTRNLMTFYKRKRTWPQMHTFYFSRGGGIEAATNFFLDFAKQRFQEEFDPGEICHEPLPAVPRCRNDHEFEMVRRQSTTVACDDPDPQASINERLSLQTPWIPLLMQMMQL